MTRHHPAQPNHRLIDTAHRTWTGRGRATVLAIGLGVAMFGLTGQASAQTAINYNELGASTGGTPMPSPHAGLSYANSNWHFMTLASAPSEVFLALSGGAATLRKADGSAFLFDGADFWSRRGVDAGGTFHYVLQLKGKVVYDGRTDKRGKMRFSGAKTLIRPSYTGPVDYVAIVFAKTGKGGDWDQLAMDNVRVRPAL
ncbi:PEP-CTERM sorting domain-containing protein [Sphaerotilus mobilis]|uniref:Uncharacterized protein n=1 Tax=Sphaerotilus mobilis TaxID=47994 RepID=A0A4Q7LDV7_9BURK|nr:PEP-CTERM sorting domain-containing protein [Sphaerotilus mobilis]RZS52121.1 hypothetical protein EV685_3310 [Sphaerotilus mobilis]